MTMTECVCPSITKPKGELHDDINNNRDNNNNNVKQSGAEVQGRGYTYDAYPNRRRAAACVYYRTVKTVPGVNKRRVTSTLATRWEMGEFC